MDNPLENPTIRAQLIAEKPELALPALIEAVNQQHFPLANDVERQIRLTTIAACLQIGRFQHALDIFQKMMPVPINDYDAASYLIRALLGCGHIDAAFSWIEAISGQSIPAQIMLPLFVRWAIAAERNDLATVYLDELQGLPGAERDYFLLQSELCTATNEKNAAVDWLQQAREQFPLSRYVWLRCIYALRDKADWRSALLLAKQAIAEFGCDGCLQDVLVELSVEDPYCLEAIQLLESKCIENRSSRFYFQRGILHFYRADLASAEIDLRRALGFANHRSTQAALMLNEVLHMQGKSDSAVQLLEEQVELEPTNVALQFALGHDYLSSQQWKLGWPRYEQRFGLDHQMMPMGIHPTWRGESLVGKKVLVLMEQGLGDAVMAASHLSLLDSIVEDWLVVGYPQLEKLVVRTFGKSRFSTVIDDALISRFDLQLGLSSLPGALGFGVNFPARPFERFFKVDSADVSRWREYFASQSSLKTIGFTWFGGSNVLNKRRRSLPLDAYLPLFNLPNYQWVSMQYGGDEVDDELLAFTKKHDLNIPSMRSLGLDLYEQAACCLALDLCISVQQTIVHVAGSVGAPLWALLPTAPEWRYGREGAKSSWYQSVRYFRQSQPFEWADVMSSVQHELTVIL